ncbi:MAG: restriction endonuclease subunit S [Candidatus Rokubacteria bacterium]|nr:restriction endonuclease subunit S [Candidatus Rokubacteria bacterium]
MANLQEPRQTAGFAGTLGRWKRYSAYKPSGVEWLGEIPAHWEVKRLKTIASVQLSNVDKKSVEGQESVRLCNYVDVYYHERISPDMDFMTATATPEQARRFSLRAGDVLITKDSESWTDIAVPAVVTSDLPDVLCGYHLALVRPAAGCHGAFLARAFAAIGPRDQFQVAANGITRFGLSGEAICTGLFAIPPLPEQLAITAFLDRETAKIDALVAKKERLIELLQEKRATLITHAVTKGLNPSASMKDSGGIEWLGQIPAHWEAKRLPFVVIVQEGPGIMASDFLEDGVPLLRIGNLTQGSVTLDGCNFLSPEKVESRWRHFRLEEGDLLISGSASTGQVSFVDSAAAGSIAYTGIFRLRPVGGNVLKEFVAYFVGSAAFLDQVNTLRTGVGIQHYGPKHLRSVWVPLPPFQEQLSIREVLDVETGKIDALIARVRKGIERLKEYRAGVISAAVTGKIDVRDEMV